MNERLYEVLHWISGILRSFPSFDIAMIYLFAAHRNWKQNRYGLSLRFGQQFAIFFSLTDRPNFEKIRPWNSPRRIFSFHRVSISLEKLPRRGEGRVPAQGKTREYSANISMTKVGDNFRTGRANLGRLITKEYVNALEGNLYYPSSPPSERSIIPAFYYPNASPTSHSPPPPSLSLSLSISLSLLSKQKHYS